MSSCLIFQRPDICSTTSRESRRTSIDASGSISTAARSPATRPEYSATLLLTMPRYSARSASTRPLAGSRTSAPYPAGPGFPREPPSASTTSRASGTGQTLAAGSGRRTRMRPHSSHSTTWSGSALRMDCT